MATTIRGTIVGTTVLFTGQDPTGGSTQSLRLESVAQRLRGRVLHHELDEADRAAGVVVDVQVLDVDPDLPRRRRTAGPARPGGRAPRRRPTPSAAPGPPCLPGIAWVPATPGAASREAPRVRASAPISSSSSRCDVRAGLAHVPARWRQDLAATGPGRRPRSGSRRAPPGPRGQVLGLRLGELPATSDGQQVRQVGGAGHRPVVLGRGEPHGSAPQQPRQRLDQGDRRLARTCTCGVIAHGRPSNSAAVAASGPDRSLPAIGWLPT